MKELTLYENEKYGVIKLNEDTTVVCVGNVVADRVLCTSNMKLIITGDSLTVNCYNNGIAIGVDAIRYDWGYFDLPTTEVKFTIDVKEIHCHSGVKGCGIGIYGIYAVGDDDFTDNCVVRDTPINMCIYNPPIVKSSRHRELPVYETVEEAKQREYIEHSDKNKRLLIDKAIEPLVVLLCEEMTSLYNESGDYKDKCINTYKAVKDFVCRLTKDTYAEGVQRIFASFAKALDSGNFAHPSIFRQIVGTLSYTCLAKELQLFERIAVLPLALRYYLVAYNLTFDSGSLDDDCKVRLTDLSLDSVLIKHYNHPIDRDYSTNCVRVSYGQDMFSENHISMYNELCVPDFKVEGYSITANNFKLLPRLNWGYSRISSDYFKSKGKAAAITYSSPFDLTLNIVDDPDADFKGDYAIVTGFDNVLTDVFSLFTKWSRVEF